jgi:hypothetical protein
MDKKNKKKASSRHFEQRLSTMLSKGSFYKNAAQVDRNG